METPLRSEATFLFVMFDARPVGIMMAYRFQTLGARDSLRHWATISAGCISVGLNL